MVRLSCDIGRRVQTREALKVVHEMRLIEVATAARNICPLDVPLRRDLPEHLLETLDAAEQFRRQSDVPAKLADEVFVTHPEPISDSAHVPIFGMLRKEIACAEDAALLRRIAVVRR